jgi:membrane associated rhomboid family serine protease
MKDWMEQLWRTLRGPVVTVTAVAALLVLVQLLSFFINTLSAADLYVLGIRPRDLSGMTGVVTAPLIHHGFGHLFANLTPLVVLALLILLEGQRRFWLVTGLVVVLSGLTLWTLGSASKVYLGASGLVFGYLGYVLARAFIVRNPIWIVAGIAVAVVYAGVVASLFTFSPHVSWLGHAAGMAAGVMIALRFPAQPPSWSIADPAVRRIDPASERLQQRRGLGID